MNVIEVLKQKKYRMTKARIDFIHMFVDGPLTMREITKYMFEKGHNNLQTIYNNIAFLHSENLLYEVFDEEKKYYLNNYDFDEDVYLTCYKTQKVKDASTQKVMALIQDIFGNQNFHIDHVSIQISGSCSNEDQNKCRQRGNCFMK